MPTVKANENEFKSQVNSWLNEFLHFGTYPFEISTSDTSVKVSEGKTKFPDVQIWLNRAAQQGFCGWELKTPSTAVDDSELLENAAEKAQAMNANYFVTWNMRDAVIWRTPLPGEKVTAQDRFKSYSSLYHINVPDDLWVEPNKIALKNRAKEVLDDLKTLYHEGHLHLIDVEATYFVGRLNGAVKTLYPHVKKSLLDKAGTDNKFKNGLLDWAIKQSISIDDVTLYETISRQVVYRLLARILFYLTLKRQWGNLPQIDIAGLTEDTANNRLRETFAKARVIDWHAVFEEDFTDSVMFPASAIEELDKLIKDLNRFNFSMMPQDVVGAVFEKFIPYEERHSLGQYFTPENLVDLIVAFCARTINDYVLDPTCGTGTFLTRAYDKIRVSGQHEHKKLLSQLWGIDIAHFPAQLATINLFRQDLSDFANFPRIVSQDFFEARVGQSFKFPPPTVAPNSSFQMVEEKLPAFDAAVGNFPYIRQELIEKRIKGYKNFLEKTLKEEWLADYPDAFVIPANELNEFKKGQAIDFSKVGFNLSGQADIYAYLFFHTARFLKEGGKMGFVTSNAWLDVAYGYELQKFLVNNFKIIAILESRCEPWFEDAAINTIVTIVERCTNKEDRDNHLAKFVKVKKKLAQLIPWDMKLEASNRWFGLDAMVHRIESAGKEHYKLEKEAIVNTLSGLESYEDDDFRIRFIKQGELLDKLNAEGKTSKWGQYLRAPQVYFDILKECGDRLVPLKSIADVGAGCYTGINDFFYLQEGKIEYWGIEDEFLVPVVRSPKEASSILIDEQKLSTRLLLCKKSKSNLTKEHKLHILQYIEWGEKQVTREKQKVSAGISWPQVPTVRNRKPGWWAIPKCNPTKVFLSYVISDTYAQRYGERPVISDRCFHMVSAFNMNEGKTLSAILNSFFVSLLMELTGRVNLGEGALKFETEDAKNLLILSPSSIDKKLRKEILEAFDILSKRPVKSIFEEVKMKDRQKLDRLILQALGLDPKKYLTLIYDGLTGLVRERMELAGMRKKVKQVKTQRDVDKLKKQVMEEVLPNGLKKFPDEFLEAPLKPQDYQNISIPGEPLKLGMFFLGTQQVVSNSGFTFEAKSVEEAKYIIYSQKADTFVVSLPTDSVVKTKAVNEYERYLDKLKNELFQAFFKRTFDHKLSDTLTQRTLVELGLSEIVQG